MKKTFSAKNLAFCALCIALCVVLPMAFHAIANAGPIFLPGGFAGAGRLLWAAAVCAVGGMAGGMTAHGR